MRNSLFAKVFGSYLVIICLILLVIPLVSLSLIRAHYVNTLTDNLKNIAVMTSPQIIPFLDGNKHKELDFFLKNLKDNVNARITIIDSDGAVIADTERDPSQLESHRMRPEIIDALAIGLGKAKRFSVTLEEEMLYVALPIQQENKILGVLRLSIPLRQIHGLLSDLQMRLIFVIAVITLVGVVIAFFLSRSITKPLHDLVVAARSLAKGEFHTRIYSQAGGELKELETGFNDMAARMEELFGRLSRRNEELDTIVSSIQEILLVLDKDGRIKQTNESFRKALDHEDVQDKFYWEVMRCPDFSSLIRKVTEERKNKIQEIEFKDKTFLCSVTFLSSKEEMVAVLYDVTELKNLERMKKDFVANISHELRTPLTAIKGFVETLEEEETIQNVQYLDTIKRHTDRLMHIVNDLLTLSELEGTESPLVTEHVDLIALVSNIIKMFDQRAQQKGIGIKLIAPEDLKPARADSYKLEQMFINLLDNALKYTEKGEVSVSLRQNGGNTIIEIKDTGIGIPASHLPRIFERFYVVDKSRSKKLGGTGLGLSIVKHIVLLHGGSIDVESHPGTGTTFTITLPMNAA